MKTSSTKSICWQIAKAVSFLLRVKNAGVSGRFMAIFSIVSLSFLEGLFKFTADGLKKMCRAILRDGWKMCWENI